MAKSGKPDKRKISIRLYDNLTLKELEKLINEAKKRMLVDTIKLDVSVQYEKFPYSGTKPVVDLTGEFK